MRLEKQMFDKMIKEKAKEQKEAKRQAKRDERRERQEERFDKMRELSNSEFSQLAVQAFGKRQSYLIEPSSNSDIVKKLKNNCGVEKIDAGWKLRSQDKNASVRAHIGVNGGRWYYEILIDKVTKQFHIGWCSDKCSPKADKDGIGRDEFSWGYDPLHHRKYHKKKAKDWNTNIGVQVGDVLGCAIDCFKKTISIIIMVNHWVYVFEMLNVNKVYILQ